MHFVGWTVGQASRPRVRKARGPSSAPRCRPGTAPPTRRLRPLSIITYYEFAEGFEKEQEQACRRALSRYRVLDLTETIAWHAGQLSRMLRMSGEPIGDGDILIAATAVCNNLTLVTRNQHFQRIPQLRLLSH